MNLDTGKARARKTIPIHRAVVLQPKWLGVTAHASTGNNNRPPNGDPSAATAMAIPRLRMNPLLIALLAGVGFIVAYHTYGRWLGSKIFRLSADAVCPSERLEDGVDYVPTSKSVVFGHHFTSIAGTGPIVGPAIAIMWGWVPALLWLDACSTSVFGCCSCLPCSWR